MSISFKIRKRSLWNTLHKTGPKAELWDSRVWTIPDIRAEGWRILSFILHKNLMKILYIRKNCSNIVSVMLVFMQLPRSLDYVILFHVTVLGMVLKGLLSIWFQWSSFLVGKVYLLEKGRCLRSWQKIISISTVYYFQLFEIKNFLKVLFSLNPVNKDLK